LLLLLLAFRRPLFLLRLLLLFLPLLFLLSLALAPLLLLAFPILPLGRLALPFLPLKFLLVDTGQNGPGQGQVVTGVSMVGVLIEHLLVGRHGPSEIANLKAGVAQVVGGVLGHFRALFPGESVSGFDVTSGAVQGDTPAVRIAELIGRAGIIALPELLLRFLFLVDEPSGMRGTDQGQTDQA
jgi:hypothetical protein